MKKYHGRGTPYSPGNTASMYQATRPYSTESSSSRPSTWAKEKSSSTVTGSNRLCHWIPVPEDHTGHECQLKMHDYSSSRVGSVGPLTFALEHADQLGSHGHGHVGDEAGGHFLCVWQQVIARPQEDIRQVAQEVDEAARCCGHIRYGRGRHLIKILGRNVCFCLRKKLNKK